MRLRQGAARPNLEISNHAAVYEYYKARRPSRALTWLGGAALATVFDVDVTFEGNAENAIERHLAARRPLLLIANHTHHTDPLIVTAGAFKTQSIDRLLDGTVVWAKSSIVNSWARRAVEAAGVIPVFRPIDYEPGSDEANLVGRAGLGLVNCTLGHFAMGRSLLCFPEGTRNFGVQTAQVDEPGDSLDGIGSVPGANMPLGKVQRVLNPDTLLEFYPGATRAAYKAHKQGIDIAAVAIGIAYAGDLRHAVMHLSEPISFVDKSEKEIREETRDTLQACSDVSRSRVIKSS
jgi:1-acyl-sn-glycerol-3-phosphate acyltransferase